MTDTSIENLLSNDKPIINYCNELHLLYIEEKNAGDIFAKFLVESLVDARIIRANKKTSPKIFQLTGSIANHSNNRTIILGTGVFMHQYGVEAFQECHAVRGTFTIGKIKHLTNNTDNIVLGDTGLLLDKLVGEQPEAIYEYGLILHYVDHKYARDILGEDCTNDKVLIINILNDNLPDLAQKLSSCRKIISSTLHGMVFSHSLGIPVSWIRLRNTSLTSDDIKFYDYLSAFGFQHDRSLCTIIDKKLNLEDLKNLRRIDINGDILEAKKNELISCLVRVFRQHNYKIKPKYQIY
ncbi:putative EXOV-like protein [Cotonvirus japonicus]|uniref:EXOV-like protein n=1 Tax=Cotonvirus japonicus TaxID=2811091 RepID=A0ABN6ED23_9VIRU|nr:putative EXOV-like protein [Cotonvirus japonicus]BCS83523.1 putative EXOV-like protein [Cotonvirus japonicus]